MVKNQRNSCCHMGCPPMIGDLHFHRRYSLRLQESKPLKNNGIISLAPLLAPGSGQIAWSPHPRLGGASRWSKRLTTRRRPRGCVAHSPLHGPGTGRVSWRGRLGRRWLLRHASVTTTHPHGQTRAVLCPHPPCAGTGGARRLSGGGLGLEAQGVHAWPRGAA